MKALRRLGFALWLALALVAGQHAAALHDLGHAAEKFSQKDSKPAPSKCGEHFACSQLVAGAAATLPSVPPVCCDVATFAILEPATQSAPALAYRSRAPPALL